MTDIRIPNGVMTVADDYKPGDLPPDPEKYLAWSEWADVQYKAGIRQVECGQCGKWKTPQELSDKKLTFNAKSRTGQPMTVELPLCTNCTELKANSGIKACREAASP